MAKLDELVEQLNSSSAKAICEKRYEEFLFNANQTQTPKSPVELLGKTEATAIILCTEYDEIIVDSFRISYSPSGCEDAVGEIQEEANARSLCSEIITIVGGDFHQDENAFEEAWGRFQYHLGEKQKEEQ